MMLFGMVALGIVSPISLYLIGLGNPVIAFLAQSAMGAALSFYAAPKMAWMVEIFPVSVRLTSMALGYNIAQAFMGGLSPAIATSLVSRFGTVAPGLYLSAIAVISITGLVCVSPRVDEREEDAQDSEEKNIATGKEIA